MSLRLFENDDDERLPAGVLALHEHAAYAVYSSFAARYIDVDGLVDSLKKPFAGQFRFWRGFAGGGVLEFLNAEPITKRWDKAIGNPRLCYVESLRGLECANAAGKELAQHVTCAAPELPPPIALKMGLTERPPKEPTVVVSAEHLDNLAGERFCLVVPRKSSKRRKHLESVSEWFAEFGIDAEICPISDAVKSQVVGWYDEPMRPTLFLRMAGGIENAAWQLAVTSYVAAHWWTQWHGLEAMHFLCEIEKKPSFRPHWLNPRYR